MNELDTFLADAAREHSTLREDVLWRLVYFKPNAYSNEAIAVAVMVFYDENVFVDHVCSTDALELFTSIFGADARDQLIFGLDTLKQWATDSPFNFDSCNSPTDVLTFGQASAGICDDLKGFSRDILRLTSSLFRRYEVVSNRFPSVGQNDVITSLKRCIVQQDPFRGRELIKPKTVHVAEGSSFKVPLYGLRTIGAPVSLMTSRVGEAIKGAEAQMLKLSHAKGVLNRFPYMYVYTPPVSKDVASLAGRVSAGLDELQVLGETSGVSVTWSDSMDKLATEVLRNEESKHQSSLSLQ